MPALSGAAAVVVPHRGVWCAQAVAPRRGVWCAQAVAAGARRQSWVQCPSGAVLTELLLPAAAVLGLAGPALQLGLQWVGGLLQAVATHLLWALAAAHLAAAAQQEQRQQSWQQQLLRPPGHQPPSTQQTLTRVCLVMTWAVGWAGPAHRTNSSSSSPACTSSSKALLMSNSRQQTSSRVGRSGDDVSCLLLGWEAGMVILQTGAAVGQFLESGSPVAPCV